MNQATKPNLPAGRLESGSIKIHKKVLAEIAHSAVRGIDGVRLVPRTFFETLGGIFLGSDPYPGVAVNVDKNNHVVIEVKINVRAGLNIPEVAAAAQQAVREAIEGTADVELKDVNVSIQGIDRARGDELAKPETEASEKAGGVS